MALYDNKYWLLSHIKNSFLLTDDTGMCELIMCGENRKHLKGQLDLYPDPDDSEDDDSLSHHSYDLEASLDFGLSRTQLTSSMRLDKQDADSKKYPTARHIKWDNVHVKLDQKQMDDLFPRRQPGHVEQTKSCFTQTLQRYTNMPKNPYLPYSMFDGTGQPNTTTKKYRIFLTVLPGSERDYPISVCCVITARIHDLIGLILLKCSALYASYPWKPVKNYALYITEEDGDVDRDFPCLDIKEKVSKFGFSCLALVEQKIPFPDIEPPKENVVFEAPEAIVYTKETEEVSAEPKPSEQSVDELKKKMSNDLQLIHGHNRALEAPLYKSYNLVLIVNKKISKFDVLLGINGDKFELNPAPQASKFSLMKMKARHMSMDLIAGAKIIETRGKKSSFRVIYKNTKYSNVLAGKSKSYTPFKEFEFESDTATADEITKKINLILELRSSVLKKEYSELLEKRARKRSSFSMSKNT